jgi:hypothetical protein
MISGFLDRIKPFRELIVLLVSVSAAISAVISWAVTHFVTQSDLAHLECRLTDQKEAAIAPLRTTAGMEEAKWRRGIANHLLDQNTDESRALARSLLAEADQVQATQENADAVAAQQYRQILTGCLSGSQPTGSH